MTEIKLNMEEFLKLLNGYRTIVSETIRIEPPVRGSLLTQEEAEQIERIYLKAVERLSKLKSSGDLK